ncbi:unnamed protein product [Linum tenue]|uniref:Uncharacterized protein n=1 Tax=Linum tenue TaxID=586396 RepID=A0AAV0RVQ6_9ROSI|nr:unnamed protein product [Linum tenue]
MGSLLPSLISLISRSHNSNLDWSIFGMCRQSLISLASRSRSYKDLENRSTSLRFSHTQRHYILIHVDLVYDTPAFIVGFIFSS